jgi:nucleoside-diphosphate-sugar epimerase
LSDLKVAITGANGFFGKYLVEFCLNEGYEVFALVRKTADLSQFQDNDKLCICAIDYTNLDQEFQSIKDEHGEIDYFIHNAGKTTSINNADYDNINTKLTGGLLESIEQVGLLKSSGKLIYISSYTAHGPVGVNHPVSFYGSSKKKAEELIQQSKFSFLIFRPTAIYGAGDKAFLPLFQAANKGIYPLTRLDQKMSMIHAADLANAVVKQMDSKNGILHVSDGITYSHSDFRNTLSLVMNRKIRNIRIPGLISKISLWFSDIWYRLSGKSPNLTLEKFEEISQDWDLHNYENLDHSEIPIKFDLKKGFEDAFNYYDRNKLL